MKATLLSLVVLLLPFAASATPAADRRAKAGVARLEASEAGRVVLRGINTHGGLDAWFGGSALRFRYAYRPVDRPARDTLQTVDLIRSRAYHDVYSPATGRMAFDGTDAWSTFDPKLIAARFWNLTPYYFVGMPFVFADPGLNLEVIDDAPSAAGLPKSTVVRVTFGEAVGDAPDDYYIAYFAEADGRLLAVRYVVSYPAFFKGAEVSHTPEKLLVFERVEPLGPLKVSRRHVFYAFGEGKRGDVVSEAIVSETAYGVPFDESQLVMPAGAVIDRSLEN
ncbi:MAG: hypothetical protein AAFU77_06885 [Myxococcota bacterium]